MGIVNKEKSRARQAVSQMFSTTSPAEDIIKKEVPEEVTETLEAFAELETVVEPEVPINPHPITQAEPKRKGRPTVNRETKKRYTLTFLPSVYDKASAKACEQGKSLSEVLGEFLSEYIKH